MTLNECIKKTGWKVLVLTDENVEVFGGFTGDLLSWVMGHGEEGQAWITVQTHLNVVAVAVLREFSCIVLANGAQPNQEMLEKAKEENISVLSTESSAFEACRKLIEVGL